MIALVVRFTAKPGTEAEVKRLIGLMEHHTRQEPGCHAYIGLQSLEDAFAFSFYEEYDDQAALDAHWASSYFAEYVTNGLALHMETSHPVERKLYTVVSEPA